MRLGVLTDLHLCPPGTPPDGCHNPYAFDQAESMLTDAIAAHLDDGVDAIAVLGDLANRGETAQVRRAAELIASVDLPVWLTGGNHDRDEDPDLLETLAKEPGANLAIARPDGVLVDGIRIAGLPITSPGGGSPWHVARLPVEGWGDEPVVLLSHFPVLDRERETRAAGLTYVGTFQDREAVAAPLLARKSPAIVLHGHLHLRDLATEGPVLQIGCAALIEPPHERVVLNIAADGSKVHVRHLPVMASPDVRLPVIGPAASDWSFTGDRWVSATIAAT
jgi:calcineurin-like phosphoesterase family protein